jgi:hypothetical protein
VYKAGYGASDVANVTYVPLNGFSRNTLRRIEQAMMDSWTDRGVTLLNTRNPEIRLWYH